MNMTLTQYQDLGRIIGDRHGNYSPREKAVAEEKIQTAQITGTVFRAVTFGSGQARGEMAQIIRRARGLRSDAQARAAIEAATVRCAGGVTAYTDRDIAEADGQDRVGMGSCTDYMVCEADPDAARDCDISAGSGPGWRRAE